MDWLYLNWNVIVTVITVSWAPYWNYMNDIPIPELHFYTSIFLFKFQSWSLNSCFTLILYVPVNLKDRINLTWVKLLFLFEIIQNGTNFITMLQLWNSYWAFIAHTFVWINVFSGELADDLVELDGDDQGSEWWEPPANWLDISVI